MYLLLQKRHMKRKFIKFLKINIYILENMKIIRLFNFVKMSVKLFDELLSVLKFILHIQMNIEEYCYDLQKKLLVI